MRAIIASTFIIACCTSTIAETLPIIDVHYGYLIGTAESGKRLESEEAIKSVKAERSCRFMA